MSDSPISFTFKRPDRVLTEEEIREWEWKNEVLPRLKGVNLEQRFRRHIQDWGSDAKAKAQARVFRRCKSLLVGNGAIVALVGLRGSGKTTIASQLIVERALEYFDHPERWPVPYTKLTDLIAMFKSIYSDHGSIETESLTRRRDEFCRYPLRVIDEIHDCDEQRLKNRIITDILDRTYAKQVDTVLIGNQTVDGFRASTSDSILSRIAEHGEIIPCEWGSWRTQP